MLSLKSLTLLHDSHQKELWWYYDLGYASKGFLWYSQCHRVMEIMQIEWWVHVVNTTKEDSHATWIRRKTWTHEWFNSCEPSAIFWHVKDFAETHGVRAAVLKSPRCIYECKIWSYEWSDCFTITSDVALIHIRMFIFSYHRHSVRPALKIYLNWSDWHWFCL